ncbi:hypothetical protein HELRODRAFT_175825 [Helobdella robusta]|uniref:Uncharacterized protein n=1 Tax=Helobdella robusta TaxID=6412 RepID=T1F9Q4_HELRO|nr:hypothetical protein HELRODRAFT_175825 [Helobdella robusta]ESO00405.1 hypothetical protein HELRODRAFT_175825 [Helobdella robusta]
MDGYVLTQSFSTYNSQLLLEVGISFNHQLDGGLFNIRRLKAENIISKKGSSYFNVPTMLPIPVQIVSDLQIDLNTVEMPKDMQKHVKLTVHYQWGSAQKNKRVHVSKKYT